MRREPTELLLNARRRRRSVAHLGKRLQPTAAHHATSTATEAIDEAFAHFPSASFTTALTAEIADQLKALDRQRDQLAQLLRTVEFTQA